MLIKALYIMFSRYVLSGVSSTKAELCELYCHASDVLIKTPPQRIGFLDIQMYRAK